MLRILHQIFRTGIVTEPIPPEAEAEIEIVGAKIEEAVRSHFQGRGLG